MSVKLFDFLNDISHEKVGGLMTEDSEKEYKPFVINRFLSASVDTVLFANDMNVVPGLSKRMQYDYLRLSIRPKKRFLKWASSEKIDALDDLEKYYGLSTAKAREIIDLHSEEQLAEIRRKLATGGLGSKVK